MVYDVRRVMARRLLCQALAGAVFASPVAAQTEREALAAAFIQATVGRMVAVIDNVTSLSENERRLQAIVDQAVDVDKFGQFCLGRFWTAASPTQQKNYDVLFHRVLMGGITENVSGYKGMAVSVGHAVSRGDEDLVATTVTRPGQAPVSVEWLVGGSPGALRIEDVIIESTSLRLTHRSEYITFLAQHDGSVDAFLAAMRAHSNTP